MDEVVLPKVHDPATLYDQQVRERKFTPRPAPGTPRDKLADLRKEPEWLLPELRMWMSMPEEIRDQKVSGVINDKLEAPYKEKLLRYIMYQEKSRKILIKIVNFIAPKV